MNFLHRLKIGTKWTLKCRRSIITSSTVNCTQQIQIHSKENAIANLCQQFGCAESIATNIYNKFPSLRPINAINNETLQWLQDKISAQSIVENPSLVTMDVGILKRKIDLLNELEPRQLDDFVPLLILDEKELSNLVKRLSKEKNEIEQGNRIYYLSEMLKVEPKVISKYRVDCGYELFFSTFRSFKKKLNIVLDYGARRKDILKSLYALRCSDNLFVLRSERMLTVGLPVKVRYYQLSEEDFDALIEKHSDSINKASSRRLATKMKKRNLEKAVIVESLKSLLECSESESAEIYYSHINEINELMCAVANVQYLLKIPICRKTILENGFLLPMPLSEIEEKLDILREMQPKKIDDFIPLMRVDTFELKDYKTDLKSYNSIGLNHPIYYFSEQLKIPPTIVAARFAESNQIFLEYEPNLLKPKLDVLVKYDVDPMSILNCKMTFRHSVETIEEIIRKLQNSGIEKISSWMIFSFHRTDHDKLISDHKREKTSLEGFGSNMEYLAYRLNWDEYDLSVVLRKCPKLSKCSASKLKGHLDYFLNETQFSAEDITYFPYILSKNIHEVKTRVVEMNRIAAPVTLPILYQGRTKYLKYIRQYCSTQGDFQAIEDRLRSGKSNKDDELLRI